MVRFISSVLLSVALLSADQLVLTSGQVVSGSYLGGDSRSVRFAVGDRVTTYSLADVRSIGFGDTQSQQPKPQPEIPQVRVPAGWDIEVKVLQAIWPNSGGKTYRAENLADIILNNQVLIPKGAQCELVSLEKPPAAVLYAAVLELRSITINGRTYPLSTDQIAVNMQPKAGHIIGFTLREPLNIGQ